MVTGEVVRFVEGCSEPWRLWTQPTWTNPQRGSFRIEFTDSRDIIFETELDWDHKATDLEEAFSSEVGWIIQVYGGPLNSQCFVLRGHKIKSIKILENNLHHARPYIWTEYNENST